MTVCLIFWAIIGPIQWLHAAQESDASDAHREASLFADRNVPQGIPEAAPAESRGHKYEYVHGTGAEIPPGFELVWITNDGLNNSDPRINNCGQIVFRKEPVYFSQVYLYDNGHIEQITDSPIWHTSVDINDSGAMVWAEIEEGQQNGIVVLVDDDGAFEIGTGKGPRINNAGHVAWVVRHMTGCSGSDADVFHFDGLTTTQVSQSGLSNQAVAINDADMLAWTRYNFCESPWVSDILIGNETTEAFLPSAHPTPQGVDINNQNVVAWGGSNGIEVWEKGVTTQLTDWGRIPRINDHGDIAFLRWHDEDDAWQVWIHFEGDYHQITDGPIWSAWADMNDYGEVVLNTGDPPGNQEIRYLRRIRNGDVDFDGDVDLNDYVEFALCRTAPFADAQMCECRLMDLDHDRDIDLMDYCMFQRSAGTVLIERMKP